MDFLVKRDDLRQCRFEAAAVPEPAPGQAVLEIESFSLTSNNVTYAVMGDAMSYWRFFPAEEGWGRVPVWGFANVAASAHEDLKEGTRLYGYYPPSSHLLVVPQGVGAGGFTEGSPHRAELPAVYNSYVRASDEPSADEDRQALFRPLFGTSFLIDDFLDDSDFFDAGSVVLGSASSKTALGIAFLLGRREGVKAIGLTSPGNAEFVRGLGVYDQVATYDEIDSLPDTPAVYVDMSGDAGVRGEVHRHYGDALAYDCVVGASHWDKAFADPGPLPGPAPEFFFAPDRFRKRREDWGPGGVESRVRDAWGPFEDWLSGWLDVVRGSGPDDVERAYLELVDGHTAPATGYVMSLPG